MKTRKQTHPNRRKGAALLFTLGTLVLLTGVIVAFFQQARLNRQLSYSYTQTAQADMLARSAIDIVAGEIRKEALDAISAGYVRVLPSKQGVTAADPEVGAYTILKVSKPGTPVAENGITFGSSVMLDDPSLNNRSNGDWYDNGPRIGREGTASDPVLPSWVYMTRGNRVARPDAEDGADRTKDDYVVGRFSYTVYDTSGMLDANVAGYPTASPFAMPTEFTGTKSSVTYADLTKVGFTAAEIDALVEWRNSSLAEMAADPTAPTPDEIGEMAQSYDEWATGIPRTTGDPNEAALAAYRSGRLQLAEGDNAFFSRGDLKRFIEDKFSESKDADTVNTMLDSTLSALTHFSRAKGASSWGPDNVGADGADYAYGTNANSASAANRYIPGVLLEEDIEVNLYSDDGRRIDRDGNYIEDGVKVYLREGEQLVHNRFSLAKLAWLGHDGPNPDAFHSSVTPGEQEDAIRETFGLEWNGASRRKFWEYDETKIGSDGHKHLLTLAEIKAAKRLPNFFELLNAGILQGSLANSPGDAALDVQSDDKANWDGPQGLLYDDDAFEGNAARHILQIGVNIIDQADNDNFPTAIYSNLLNTASLPASEGEFFNTVFGIENLPMLSRVGLVSHMLDDADPDIEGDDIPKGSTPDGDLSVWAQPEVWNPNHPGTAGEGIDDANYPTPDALRMVTYGSTYLENTAKHPDNQATPESDTTDFGNNYYNPDAAGIIYFKIPGAADQVGYNATGNMYESPRQIYGGPDVRRDVDFNHPDWPTVSHNLVPEESTEDWSAGKRAFMGVLLGTIYHNPGNYPTNSIEFGQTGNYSVQTHINTPLTFVLEYFDGTDWRPYSSINRLNSLHSSAGGGGSRRGQMGWANENGFVDPRTDRFSSGAGRQGAGQNEAWRGGRTILTDYTNGEPNDIGTGRKSGRNPRMQAWPRESSGFSHTPISDKFYLFDEWLVNDESNGFYYEDPDGIVRQADGYLANYESGEGVITYHKPLDEEDQSEGDISSPLKNRRGVILNRPFRTVGELGYVFRDQPFRTLDFWSETSADAGLLDLFTVTQVNAETYAGSINPSTAPSSVLLAMLSGAHKHSINIDEMLDDDEATAVITAIQAAIGTASDLENPAGIATELAVPMRDALISSSPSSPESPFRNKGYAEAPVRVLASNMSGRVWNLMVDVVAQSGRLSSAANGLDDFVVEGEKRYWMHLAIDRDTGDIIDSQLEPYYE